MARVRSTQKLPRLFILLARETANHRNGNRYAGGRGSEVLHRQRGHLHEIA